MSLMEGSSHAEMLERGGFLSTEDGGIAVLAGSTLGGGELQVISLAGLALLMTAVLAHAEAYMKIFSALQLACLHVSMPTSNFNKPGALCCAAELVLLSQAPRSTGPPASAPQSTCGVSGLQRRTT
jgi:hypothetical protein